MRVLLVGLATLPGQINRVSEQKGPYQWDGGDGNKGRVSEEVREQSSVFVTFVFATCLLHLQALGFRVVFLPRRRRIFFASADSADCTAGPLPHLCVPLKAPWLEVETLHPASAWAGWKRKAAGAGSTMRAWVASTLALGVGRGRSAVPS